MGLVLSYKKRVTEREGDRVTCLCVLRYVEEYRMSDIEREVGLQRERLVELALLLGSDYTEVGVEGGGGGRCVSGRPHTWPSQPLPPPKPIQPMTP